MKILSALLALAGGFMTLGACTNENAPSDMLGDKYEEVPTPDKKLHLYMPKERGSEPMPLIIILPGGGYSVHTPNESYNWVPLCLDAGFAAAVLEYDLPNGEPERTVSHVNRSISYLKSAASLNIDPHSVGVWGFSAGAHLASLVATQADADCRPAFQVLFYPVISMEDDHASTAVHRSTRTNLLGENPPESKKREYSSQLRVDRLTPEAFIAVGDADVVIAPANSSLYAEALDKNDVANVVMIAPGGSHGTGGWSNLDHILQTLQSWLHQRIAKS